MDDIYSTILDSYRKYPVSSYVYLVEVLVTVFSTAPEFMNPITLLFENTVEITFYHLGKLKDIEDNAGLADDFFGMLSRFVRFMPQIINNCKHFDRLLKLTEIACELEQSGLAKTFYAFMEDLYMQFWNVEMVKKLIEEERPKDTIVTERTAEMLESRERVK